MPVAGVRERAQSTAIAAYTAAHGHPLDHPGADTGGRRWGLRTRVAVAACVAVVGLGGFVVLRSAQAGSVVVGREAGAEGEDVAVIGAVPDEAEALDGAAGADVDPALGPGAGLPGQDALGSDGTQEGRTPSDPDRSAGRELVVHVVGEVVRPGVIHLPDGARVADAVDGAGGATDQADLGAINLARQVVDGEQILVPAPGEQVPEQAADSPGPLDLNGADAGALDDLPGIGPVLAERIVTWRSEHGPFSSVDELAEVSGIGPALLSDLRELVRV